MPKVSISPTGWLTVQNTFTQVFGAAIFAVLAPILGPRALGLVALVMVFIGFFEAVLEIAATDALLSIREIEGQHYATATTANVVFACVLAIAVLLFAEPIAAVLKEPELAQLLRVMAILPVFSALISAPSAATRRDLKFGPLAVRTILSTLIGGVVGLILAFMHFGVWALVWQTLIQRVLSAAILWFSVPIPLRFGFSRPHFRDLMRYATPMIWTQGMSWAAGQVPRLLLGYFLGVVELGLFSLAARLNELVLLLTLSPRYGVARVEMSKFGEDMAGLRVAIKRVLAQMGFLCFPVCIGGAAIMPTLYAVWLDARWSAGISAAQLIFLGTMGFVTHYALSAALLGMNRQSAVAISATAQALVTVIVVPIFAPFGLNIAAAAFALRIPLTTPVPVRYVHQYAGITFWETMLAQRGVFLAALTMGAAVVGLRLTLAPYVNQGVLLVLLVLTGTLVYAAMVAKLEPDIAAQYLRRFQRLLPGARNGPTGA